MTGPEPAGVHRCLFEVADFVGEVRSNDETWIEELRRAYYRPAAEPARPRARYRVFVDRRFCPDRRHVVSEGERHLLITAFYPAILPTLEWHITRAVAAALPSCVLLRAAAVVHRGRSALILGRDGLQNRICKVLADRDAAVYADEVAIVRLADRRLVHHPKSIGLRRPRHGLVSRQRKQAPFRGGERTVTTYLPPCPAPPETSEREVETLVFLEPERAERCGVAPISRAEAHARLCEHVWGMPPLGEERFLALAGLAGACRVHRLAPAGLERTADLVLGTLS